MAEDNNNSLHLREREEPSKSAFHVVWHLVYITVPQPTTTFNRMQCCPLVTEEYLCSSSMSLIHKLPHLFQHDLKDCVSLVLAGLHDGHKEGGL